MALTAVDRKRKLWPRLTPPGTAELNPDLGRWSILEFTNGAPMGIIVVNIDSTEIHEAETLQRDSRNKGRIFLFALNPID